MTDCELNIMEIRILMDSKMDNLRTEEDLKEFNDLLNKFNYLCDDINFKKEYSFWLVRYHASLVAYHNKFSMDSYSIIDATIEIFFDNIKDNTITEEEYDQFIWFLAETASAANDVPELMDYVNKTNKLKIVKK